MKKSFFLFTLVFIGLLSGCEEAVVPEKDYPYLITKDVSNITDNSVVFNGEIISTGDEQIIEYGFLWDLTGPGLDSANKVVIGNENYIGSFSVKIDTNLYKETQQYVRTYIITESRTVLGNPVKFICNGSLPAEITSIEPLQGYGNETIVIKGDNFSDKRKHINVYYGDTEMWIESCSKSELVVRIPAVETDQEEYITLEVYNKSVKSDDKFRAFTYWRRIGRLPGGVRYGASAFSIDNTGYVCLGKTIDGPYRRDLYALDPETGLWKQKESCPGAGRAYAVSGVIEGKAYAGFGYANNIYYHDLWQYDPANNSWEKMLDDPRINTFGNASFVLNGELYIFTQVAAYKYSPQSNEFTQIDNFPGEYRFFTTGLTCEGKGYILCGQEPGNHLKKDLWCYDPSTGNWTEKAELPEGYRDGIAAFVLNGKIYAGLGGIWGGDYLDFYEYNPASNTWLKLQNFPGDKRELSVGLSAGNKGFVGTGRRMRSSEDLDDFWEFDPNKD